MTERKMKYSGDECIGLIPEDWTAPRLKYHCIIKNGSDPLSNSGPIPVYGSGTGIVKYCTEYKNGPAILLGRKGTLDKPKLITEKFWNVDTVFDAYPRKDINIEYLYNVTKILDILKYATCTAKPSMTQTDYNSMIIPCPDIVEQQQIVEYLDFKTASIDSAIQAQKDIVEKLKEYRQAVITEAVTKGLNRDAEMKDSGIEWIGKIPQSWKVMPNKYLMTKQKDLCPVYNGENILSLSMRGVYVRDPYDESGKRPKTYDGYQFVYDGDLLMCLFDIDVTPRCVGRVYDNGLTSPAYSRFVMNRKKANVDYYYYYYLALDFDKTLLHLAKNMRSSFTETDFGCINAPVPPIKEQQQIVEYLDSKTTTIDKAIEQKNAIIEKLEEYKKSIIYNAVTGKIDCRKDVIPE